MAEAVLKMVSRHSDDEGTVKYLWQLADDRRIGQPRGRRPFVA